MGELRLNKPGFKISTASLRSITHVAPGGVGNSKVPVFRTVFNGQRAVHCACDFHAMATVTEGLLVVIHRLGESHVLARYVTSRTTAPHPHKHHG